MAAKQSWVHIRWLSGIITLSQQSFNRLNQLILSSAHWELSHCQSRADYTSAPLPEYAFRINLDRMCSESNTKEN